MYDIIIIGAGVSGCAIARELSRYKLKICVAEKNTDVCEGTSKANSGIVHAGFDAKEGSLMAKLNVIGSRVMDEVSEELDFPFKRNGSMVVCQDAEGFKVLHKLRDRGIKNGVEGICILKRDEALKIEPNLADTVYAALFAPSGGIVCPFNMTIAYAENAFVNGVEFKLGTEVHSVHKINGHYILNTNAGDLETACVINAAGVYADVFHNMVSKNKIHITPRKGDYCLFDKTAGNLVSHTVFQLPTAMGKGVLVTPTIHGNLLIGPTALSVEDKEETATTAEEINSLAIKASLSVKGIPMRQVITSFAGLRAHEDGSDFIIEEVADAEKFIDVAGIESPGLSSAPAIGFYVRDLIKDILNPEINYSFIGTRNGITAFTSLSKEEQKNMINDNPAYGRVVCRCETVTEAEVLEAIHRPLGAVTLDGIKRRTRAGMGRCQAGFCTSRVMEILSNELKISKSEIRKNGMDSKLITGLNKDGI